MKRDDRDWVRSFGLFSVVVADLIICSGVGVGIGYWAWKHWGAPWWVILVSSTLGLVVAFYRLYRISQLGDKT